MRVSPETKIEDIETSGHQRPSLALCIPSVGMVSFKFTVAFARLQMPTNGSVITHASEAPKFHGVEGFEVGAARNMLVDEVFKNDSPLPKYIFFLGDDMLPAWNGLITLYEEMESGKWDVLTGLYYIKQNEVPTPLMWRNDQVGRMRPGVHFEVGEATWVDLTGLDFTLMRTDLFRRLKKPYFKTGPTLKEDGGIWKHTEDAWFMKQVKEVGGRIGVHTGVRVAHFDYRTGQIY